MGFSHKTSVSINARGSSIIKNSNGILSGSFKISLDGRGLICSIVFKENLEN